MDGQHLFKDTLYDAVEDARFLKAVANPWRLRILAALLEGPKNVGELEESLDLGQAYVSQQLARLRGEKLVLGQRNGREVRYTIVDDRVRHLLEVLYRFQTAASSGKMGEG